MKRMIVSSSVPGGYLKTNKFNSRINDNNVLEAVEIAITEKFDQFQNTMNRQFALTSGTGWQGEVTEYPEGYYIMIDVTRGGFQAFVQGDSVIRKPRTLSEPIAKYSISGDEGHVEYVSSPKYIKQKAQEAKSGEWQEKFDNYSDARYFVLRTETGHATVTSFFEGDDFEGVSGYVAKVFKGQGLAATQYFYNDEYMALARAKAWAEDELMGYHDDEE